MSDSGQRVELELVTLEREHVKFISFVSKFIFNYTKESKLVGIFVLRSGRIIQHNTMRAESHAYTEKMRNSPTYGELTTFRAFQYILQLQS